MRGGKIGTWTGSQKSWYVSSQGTRYMVKIMNPAACDFLILLVPDSWFNRLGLHPRQSCLRNARLEAIQYCTSSILSICQHFVLAQRLMKSQNQPTKCNTYLTHSHLKKVFQY